MKINWRSKIIDLLIVIIGISVAFKLNTWNESIAANKEAQDHINSFYEETEINKAKLVGALEFSETSKQHNDTLKEITVAKDFADSRFKDLVLKMLGLSSLDASTTTMENITASGEFGLIKDTELRRLLISTYNSYKRTLKVETLLFTYVNDRVSPFVFENFSFNGATIEDATVAEGPLFQNIVFVYGVLLDQQIRGYQNTLERMEQLELKLGTATDR